MKPSLCSTLIPEGPGSANKVGGMALKKAFRIARQKKATEERKANDKRESVLLGEKIFDSLPYSVLFEVAEAFIPPASSSEIARCFYLEPQSTAMKNIKHLWKGKGTHSKNALPRSWAVNLVEAAYIARRIDTIHYMLFRRQVSPRKAIIIPNKRHIDHMVEVLNVGSKLSK